MKTDQEKLGSYTKESVYAWFDEFEQFCKEKNITSTYQVYNFDKSGFLLQTESSLKVCVDRHCKPNFQITSNNKVSITTLQCICTNGNTLLPSVLFPEVNFNPEYSVG